MPVDGLKLHQIKTLVGELKDDLDSFQETARNELTELMECFDELQDVFYVAEKNVGHRSFCTARCEFLLIDTID